MKTYSDLIIAFTIPFLLLQQSLTISYKYDPTDSDHDLKSFEFILHRDRLLDPLNSFLVEWLFSNAIVHGKPMPRWVKLVENVLKPIFKQQEQTLNYGIAFDDIEIEKFEKPKDPFGISLANNKIRLHVETAIKFIIHANFTRSKGQGERFKALMNCDKFIFTVDLESTPQSNIYEFAAPPKFPNFPNSDPAELTGYTKTCTKLQFKPHLVDFRCESDGPKIRYENEHFFSPNWRHYVAAALTKTFNAVHGLSKTMGSKFSDAFFDFMVKKIIFEVIRTRTEFISSQFVHLGSSLYELIDSLVNDNTEYDLQLMKHMCFDSVSLTVENDQRIRFLANGSSYDVYRKVVSDEEYAQRFLEALPVTWSETDTTFENIAYMNHSWWGRFKHHVKSAYHWVKNLVLSWIGKDHQESKDDQEKPSAESVLLAKSMTSSTSE